MHCDYITDTFSVLLKKFGLSKIKYHELRHSCLTILANDPNFTMKQVQEDAHHANFNTTANIYSHVDISHKKDELDLLTMYLIDDKDNSKT